MLTRSKSLPIIDKTTKVKRLTANQARKLSIPPKSEAFFRTFDLVNHSTDYSGLIKHIDNSAYFDHTIGYYYQDKKPEANLHYQGHVYFGTTTLITHPTEDLEKAQETKLDYYTQHYVKEDYGQNYFIDNNQFNNEEDLFQFPFKTSVDKNNISHIATDRIQVFNRKSPPNNLKRQINPTADHYTTLGFKETTKIQKKLLNTDSKYKNSILKHYKYKKQDILQIQFGATRHEGSLNFSVVCGNPIAEKTHTYVNGRKNTARNTVYNSKTTQFSVTLGIPENSLTSYRLALESVFDPNNYTDSDSDLETKPKATNKRKRKE